MVRRHLFSLSERPVLADGSHISLGEALNTEAMSTALTDNFTFRFQVSGHRVPTAEIEAALLEYGAVAEATALGIHDELSGEAVNAFVSTKNKDGNYTDDELMKEFIIQVNKSIGPFASP